MQILKHDDNNVLVCVKEFIQDYIESWGTGDYLKNFHHSHLYIMGWPVDFINVYQP